MIQKDVRLALSKSSTVFINYLTSTANDLAITSGAKTINSQYIMAALDELEFDSDFKSKLELELQEFREITRLRKEQKSTGADTAADARPSDDIENGDDEGDEDLNEHQAMDVVETDTL
ncbi:DNA polymerase epsilon subunit 3 [Smittium mucronatum]|uniref:DNA polymerase epsilon subunit D n=1 Tax=Smittium mucronatum TaxID=133383 RepID=A0A1R0H8M7_9FUNG|nr:DNA polymerase epsilon subunit 3 [Smittium mucronatum]